MEWDFIANAAVDALDLVPENLRGYYQEDKANNNFVLKAEVKPLADAYTTSWKAVKTLSKKKTEDNNKDATRRAIIDGLVTKLTEAGIEVGEDHTKLGDIVSAKLTELTESVKGGKEVKTNLEAIKKQFEANLAKELGKKDAQLSAMKTSLEKYLINSSAATALAAANPVERGLELLMPQILRSAKVVQSDDGEYSVKVVDAENNERLNAKGESMTIADLVNEMKVTYPMAFKSEAKGGGGKQPDSSKRPVTPTNKGNDNLTPVQKISAGLAAMKK